MSKRKKKNAVKLSLLLLALIALIGFYVWYSKNGKSDKKSKNQTTQDILDQASKNSSNKTATISLAAVDSTLVNSLHFVNKSTDLTLVLKDGIWKSDLTPDRPINQENVTKILSAIKDVKAIRTINEKPGDLSEYGLKEPASTLTASQSDGKTLTLKIGNESAGGNGYYALVNAGATVYLIDTTLGEAFSYSDTDMTAVEEMPAITKENIRHITITKRDGNDFEMKYETNNKADTTGSGFYPWIIVKPYEEGYNADSSKITDLLTQCSGLKLVSCVDYSGKDLSKYGLDNPEAVLFVEYEEQQTKKLDTPEKDPATGKEITEKTVTETKNYKLYLGNKDESGNYYVTKEGSNAVYTIKPDDIDNILKIDAFSIMNKYICIPNIENVDKIEVEAGGNTDTMEIKRTTKKDASGKDTTEAAYYHNGNTVDEATFKGVYQKLIVAKYDSVLDKEVDTNSQKPVITIRYYMGGNKLTTSYLPYNDSFYIVNNGGKVRFCADKRQIDEIITAVKEFKAAAN